MSLALLVGLPTLVAVFLKATGIGPRPGEGPPFLSAVLNNGVLFPAAALAIVLPLFLPISVAVVAGDMVAGEAAAGTLRYLLVRPVSRTKLLVVKLAVTAFYVLLAVVLVAGVAYLVGRGLFGVRPVTSLSGPVIDARWRVVATVLYVGWSMLGVASVALFLSTVTDSALGAALGSLAVLVTSQVLDVLDAAASVQPYLPTRYWLSFVDLFREPVLWRNVHRGIGLQAIYMAVLLGLAWANFASKDVTS